MAGLAVTLYRQGDLTGAQKLQEQLLEARRRLLGEEHPDTLGAMINLAGTLFKQGDLTGARIAAGPQAFHDTSPTTQIDDRLAPRDGDIIVRKTRVGAFSTTDLAQQLADRGIDTLILAGISTSGVVLSTVRDGADRDYALYVLSDATADRDASVHACLMEKVFPRQADVITVAELEGLLAAD